MDIKINEATEKFVEELRSKDDVKGVLLFGSYARGNQRPGSDVDLIVILENGFKRAVENHYDQIFEIIYLTADSAVGYWREHRDETARLWAIAKILYDKDGVMKDLADKASKLIAEGKAPIDSSRLSQLLFDARDQLEYAKYVYSKGDAATANMIISNKAFALAQLYFDIKQEWAPAPKQMLETIRVKDAPLYSLFEEFYANNVDFDQKLTLLGRIIGLIFAK